jgi:putative transposase
MKVIKTYKYRLKSKNTKFLSLLAKEVNFVWNYFNETSLRKFKESRKHISEFDLNKLTTGSTKAGLNLNSASIQEVSRVFCKSKIQHRKVKLRWRGKRSLGFIPVRTLKITEDGFKFNGKEFRIWKHRDFEGKIKASTISQDSKGYWYLNLYCEQEVEPCENKKTIGVDLGLKTVATTSTGNEYNFDNLTKKYEEQLAKAQRAKNKKQVTNVHRKIKNSRKDANHKISKAIIDEANVVFVGDVNSSKLIKNKRFRKSVLDRSWFQLKSMLHYKAMRAGGYMKEINESFTSVTCSACSKRTGPSGLSCLSIREWKCENCGTTHKRDVNAAINIEILGVGYDSP